ncbi:Coiled-coil domain-containing protein 108 [Papilio xuthus]|uniref:Coiled-coil domain-containing protein 108 n=1 Tax=Papilio xuthus TaxID=66420 RepID=A0A194PE41_PAPXU|nr:Coiled-coil domain-containing protein 108 [Papilio xuthus]
MQNLSDESISEIKLVNFGSVAVDTVVEKYVLIQNVSDRLATYRISLLYILNTIDQVFKVEVTSTPVKPQESAEVKIIFKPNVVGLSYTEYYIVDDTYGNSYRITVTGKCFGPKVILSKKKITFTICKNVSEQRKDTINILNKTNVDTTYQWLLPYGGQGFFQISTGSCGLIRAFENIPTTIAFTGVALGLYTAELVFLVLNQEPLFVSVIATVSLPASISYNVDEHVFEKHWKRKSRYHYYMENSLNRLTYIPSASVYERYLDFGMGSPTDISLNISQTLCVTNHEPVEGYMQWIPDPDNIFLVDPIDAVIPSNESRLFTIRFRPKIENDAYGYLLCGDYQYKVDTTEGPVKFKHTWVRIPCIGNTWSPCTEWLTAWDCPIEVTLPPTVPARTTFTNFMLSNKLEIPMYFKFQAPYKTNFVVMPMCGIVQGRGWQIVSVALEPMSFGEYYESWDLIINRAHKARVSLCGNAEVSQIDVMSHGYNPSAHAMYEFPPTITGCTNYCTAYLHNLTRMEIHMRVLNNVEWLGADDGGTIVLPPREIVRYHWWFFPKETGKVYGTTICCSCVCLINGKPIGEPSEIFINITGFSETPDLRVLPKTTNLHDLVVGATTTFNVTLYNYGTCFFTSKLYYDIDGMGDDFQGDRIDIDNSINSLKPSNYCEVKISVTPKGAGSRQVDIRYTVLYRSAYDEIEEIQPVTKSICTFWLNKALMDVRPNNPLDVNLYAPELCIKAGQVELVFVFGCVYAVSVPWNIRRRKICDCPMVEVQIGISTFEMRHTCGHRNYVKLSPSNGIVSPEKPNLLFVDIDYGYEGLNTLCFVMTMPNQRVLHIYINVYAHLNTKGTLAPLRRPQKSDDYLAVLDCGRVPINNLDPVIRIIWLYNPTEVYTTWRLLAGNTSAFDSALRCLQYFAEVSPLDKLAIPFAFLPTEMVDYETVFNCSFGYDIIKILVKGQGGLPNCIETRLDIPSYIERNIRAAYRENVFFSFHMLVYDKSLSTTVSCEVLDLTERRRYQCNEHLKKTKIEKCNQEFIITEEGLTHPGINDSPPYVLDIEKPQPFYLSMSVSISSKGQRDGYPRLLLKQMWEQTPPYDLLSTEMHLHDCGKELTTSGNNMTLSEIIRIIEGILWDALNSKMFKYQIEHYTKEEIPTYQQLVNTIESDSKPRFSKRITSGICDAIVNKAIFNVYSLNSKSSISILEAE